MTPKPNSRECPSLYAHLPISSGLPSAKFDMMIEYTETVLFTIILCSSSQLTTVEISHIVSISQFYSLSLFCTTDFLALFFYFPSSSALLGKSFIGCDSCLGLSLRLIFFLDRCDPSRELNSNPPHFPKLSVRHTAASGTRPTPIIYWLLPMHLNTKIRILQRK